MIPMVQTAFNRVAAEAVDSKEEEEEVTLEEEEVVVGVVVTWEEA